MAANPKCDPLENNINVPHPPPLPGLPGFTLDVNFPTPNIGLPEGIPEDILDWVRRLQLSLPGGGLLKEMLETLQETIAAIISHLLAYLNMFMSFYNFALAIIEVIICIINVLTAVMNPFKVIKRVKCLIRKCFPLFIRVVLPFFAYLALLLALLALLLALIEYIIALLKRLIEQLLKNLKRLTKMFEQGNSNTALAIVSKIADLMCLFEHIFVLLGVIDLIISLVKDKWEKTFKQCNGSDNNSGNILSEDALCASFLQAPESLVDADNEVWKSRVKGSNGELWYCNEVYGAPFVGFPATSVAKLRPETVYLRDTTLVNALQFKNMIAFKPLSENREFPFFPFDSTITASLPYEKIPYFSDITVYVDPNDGYGPRNFLIENTVVTLPTYNAILTVTSNNPITTYDPTAFLTLSGGQTTNDVYGYNGYTIAQLLKAANPGLPPSINGNGGNSYYTNINHQLEINFLALAEYMLITMDCIPSVKEEFDYFETVNEKSLSNDLASAVDLPDVGSAISNMTACLNNYQSNITLETTEEFSTCMNEILSNLSDEANTAYCQLLEASIDIYNTDVDLEPEIQFVTEPIEIIVTPKNNDGNTLADLMGGFSTSIDVDGCLASKFTADATLGNVSDFAYDGYGNFIAQIISHEPGDGYVTISFDGEQIPQLSTPTNLNQEPSINNDPLEYSFVGFFVDGYGAGVLPLPRREERDTSNG